MLSRSTTRAEFHFAFFFCKQLFYTGNATSVPAKTWSALPANIRSQTDFNTFKSRLNTSYFRRVQEYVIRVYLVAFSFLYNYL